MALWVALACAVAPADDLALTLRFAWGGGNAERWVGSIAIDAGQIDAIEPLGIEADEAGSMWVEGNRIVIAPRNPRSYDGVDVQVTAPADAKLQVALEKNAEATTGTAPAAFEIPLASLINDAFVEQLEGENNRLIVRRTPGDKLRITLPRESLIFAPNETIKLGLASRHLGVEPGTRVRYAFELHPAGSTHALWRTKTSNRSRRKPKRRSRWASIYNCPIAKACTISRSKPQPSAP